MSKQVASPHTDGAKGSLQNDHPTTTLALSAAAIVLGYALEISNGILVVPAIVLLTAAVGLCLLGVAESNDGGLDKFGDRAAAVLLLAGLCFQIYTLLTHKGVTGSLVAALVVIVTVLALAPHKKGSQVSEWSKHTWVFLLLVSHFVLGVIVIKSSPDPNIDVFLYHQKSLEALLKGIDPYAITVPNIYGHTRFYGEGIVIDGVVNMGFPYPPLSLLLSLPGYLLGGDYRYSNLAALTLSGALMAYSRPGRLSALAAGVFLSTPRVFYVLDLGWTEPHVVLLFAATVFSACRAPRYLPWVLGLLLAVKQHMVFVAPLVVVLLPPPVHWKEVAKVLGKAALLAAVINAPFVLWNVRAFIDSVIVFHLRQPFRPDSLSYLALFRAVADIQPPSWVGLALMMPASVWAARRAARTPAGFAVAVSFAYLIFFAFSKQAFCNYYFFIVGVMCCSVAASRYRDEEISVTGDRAAPEPGG